MISYEHERELDAFFEFIKDLNIKRVIETGVREGHSTRRFLDIVEVLVSIEISPPKCFFKHDNWILVKKDSKEALEPMCKLLEPVDLFFHDSDHSVLHRLWEYETALPYCRYIASHDVKKDKVWEYFLKRHGLKEIFRKGKVAVAVTKP